LKELLSDPDGAVRYWAALGFLMRGEKAVTDGRQTLRAGLADESPYVRIVAAQALAQFGASDDLQPALAALGDLAPPDKHDVFVSMAALNAIETLGAKAATLHGIVRAMPRQGPSPDARFDSYVPRLVAHITGEPAEKPKAKAKAKAKAKQKKQ
jgi:uncharacterized sulfatase